MVEKREGDLAGRHHDMGIKTIEGQDTEGHVKGGKQSESVDRTKEWRAQEDDSKFNKKDARQEGRDV